MADDFVALIMAAGKGTRMRSELPKVLHPLCGRPMVGWVIEAARSAGAGRVVCVTRPGNGLADALPDGVEVAEQSDGEGTGAAVLAARAALDGESRPVIVLSGDHPLIGVETLAALARTHADGGAAATVLTTEALDPAGYGRIVRAADGSLERIAETKHPEDATAEELAIREVNLGTYAFEPAALFAALDAVELERGERFLTAALPHVAAAGGGVVTHVTEDVSGAIGINDRAALMHAEGIARRRLIDDHARAGVTFTAPDTVALDAGVELGEDTVVEAGVTLRGATRAGRGCRIGPQVTATGAVLGDEVTVLHAVLHDCEVERGATVGPFAYLRPAARIGPGAKVGTYVEVKNANIGAGAKVPHLSYIGDADVGEGANVAAGNVTANYDGFEKHRTEIGKSAKTGVNTSFVAPVRVGDEAYTGAGSVITEDVPDGALGISRPPQENVEGYAERAKKERG
jgi:bifunctional UDP-N-acetylglucosamine pyrophosphorylase/glucosamine-1-phosphate N-acetyltransferase